MHHLALLAAIALAVPDAPSAPNAKPVDPDQKVRCQREAVTGSLVGSRKICHTIAQWRQLADATQSDARRMMDQGLICPGCQGH